MFFINLIDPLSGYYVMEKETDEKCIMPMF